MAEFVSSGCRPSRLWDLCGTYRPWRGLLADDGSVWPLCLGAEAAAAGPEGDGVRGAWVVEMSVRALAPADRFVVRFLGGRVGRPRGDMRAALAAARVRFPGCEYSLAGPRAVPPRGRARRAGAAVAALLCLLAGGGAVAAEAPAPAARELGACEAFAFAARVGVPPAGSRWFLNPEWLPAVICGRPLVPARPVRRT